MSGLLFLLTVAGFVALAYWAYRNDAMGVGDSGSGILAMRTESPKTKSAPKWKKAAEPRAEESRSAHPPAGGNPGWKRGFLPGPRG